MLLHNPKHEKPLCHCGFAIEKDHHDRIKKIAGNLGVSKAHLLRIIVKQFIEEKKWEKWF